MVDRSSGLSSLPPAKEASNTFYRLIESAVRRPFTTLTVALAIFILGTVSVLSLRMEYLPTLHIPVVHVVTEYKGFPAGEVERLVTIPLENGLSAVKGVRRMESITKEGISTIILQFDWKVDLRRVTVDVREKIDSTYPYLPYGIQKPLVYTEDLNATPILVLSVLPLSGRTLQDITPLVRKELSSRLLRIKGVSSLRMVGTSELEVLVEGKSGPVRAGIVSLPELAETIETSVFQASLGTLTEGEREFLVEADTGVDSIEALANIPLRARNGADPTGSRLGAYGGSASGSDARLGRARLDPSFSSIPGTGSPARAHSPGVGGGIGSGGGSGGAQTLKDVAEISLREKEKTSFFHWNGEEGIGIFLFRMPDASSLRTAQEVIDTLPYLNTLFQREFRLEVIQNPTLRIESAFRSLIGSIGMGVLAVFLVLSFTFKDLQSPLIISFSIPLSTLGVFFYLYLSRMSLNTVSLAGIALGVGMIVDNSIVVLENLHRRTALKPDSASLQPGHVAIQSDRITIRPSEICEAVVEVLPSLFSSTLTTVLVFLPIVLIPGVLGALFQELAFTISSLIVLSLGISLFFTPVLYLLFAHRRNRHKVPRAGRNRSAPVTSFYRSYLLFTFRYPAIPVFTGLLFVGAGCIAYFLIPKHVLPEETPESLILTVRYPAGTSLDRTSREALALEKRILPLRGVKGVFAEAGYEARSLQDRGAPDRNSWTVRLTVEIAGKEALRIRSELDNLLAEIGGIEYRIERPADGTSRLLGATDAIRLRIQGPDREELITLMETLFHQAGIRPLLSSSDSDTRKMLPQKTFHVEEDLATYHGITPQYILDALTLSVRGTVVSTLPIRGEDVEIRLRLRRENPPENESVSLSKLPLPIEGGVIQAGTVGTLTDSLTYPSLHRVDRKPSVTATFYPREGKKETLETLLETFSQRLPGTADGIHATLLSHSALKEQNHHILQVFAIALLLMYLVLGAQFESFGIPLLLLVSFPLSVSGSFLCLYLFGFSLNLNSFLGILVLLGTIINGTILLTSAYQRKDENSMMGEGVLEETVKHTRPLLATTHTTLVAMLPLLLAGRGSMQTHTAVALGGGLGMGTLLILAVYPGLYRLIYRRKHSAHPLFYKEACGPSKGEGSSPTAAPSSGSYTSDFAARVDRTPEVSPSRAPDYEDVFPSDGHPAGGRDE